MLTKLNWICSKYCYGTSIYSVIYVIDVFKHDWFIYFQPNNSKYSIDNQYVLKKLEINVLYSVFIKMPTIVFDKQSKDKS